MGKQLNTPWYERNVFWGPVSLGCGIILAVIASMKADLRWLFWFAWPLLSAGVFGATKHRKWVWPTTIVASLVLGVGLLALSRWLRLSIQVPIPNKPLTFDTSQHSSAGEAPPTHEPKDHTSAPRTHGGTASRHISQKGNGNQQTVNQGPISQANSGGCNQQVVGGNGNTNICAVPPRALTELQGKQLASAIGEIPDGIQVKIGSADSGESHDYAEQIRKAFGIQREVGTLFGWHPKGVFVGVNARSDRATAPAQKLAIAMKGAGLNIVDFEEDPTHDHPGEIEVIVGEQ
jgi:hypothetical protein